MVITWKNINFGHGRLSFVCLWQSVPVISINRHKSREQPQRLKHMLQEKFTKKQEGTVNRMNILKKIDKTKTGIFAAGVLFGTAGIKILSSKDAKKVYTQCTAAVLRAKECVMKTVTSIQENAEDIYAEAQQINETRAEEEKEFADESCSQPEAEE